MTNESGYLFIHEKLYAIFPGKLCKLSMGIFIPLPINELTPTLNTSPLVCKFDPNKV